MFDRLTTALAAPVTRRIGFAAGLLGLAYLTISLVRTRGQLIALIAGVGWGGSLVLVVGFTVFHIASATALGLLGGHPSAQIWASAQILKYLPVPGSAAVGMVGAAVQLGQESRPAVGLMVRLTGVLVGAAVLVGSPAYVISLRETTGLPRAGGLTICVLVGLAALMASTWGRGPRGAGAAAAALVGWTALAITVGIAFGSEGQAVRIGSALAGAWVAGQIVVPVPAGLGVREAAFVALLGSAVGLEEALGIAVLTRAAHAASDGTIGLMIMPRWRMRSKRGRATAP